MRTTDLPVGRADFLAELAEEVWREFSGERQVFLDGVAEQHEISISHDDYGDAFDGLLEHQSGEFHIYCNTARCDFQNAPRARFTVAHELGHFFIDEHRNALLAGLEPHRSFTEYQSESRVEAEADHFAANLLMPKAEFVKALAELTGGIKSIIQLASTFGVSRQSAALRYVMADLAPCAVIFFSESGKIWPAASPSLARMGYKLKWLDGPPGRGSATAFAKADTPRLRCEPHLTNSLASDWFEGIRRGSEADSTLRESALRLGSRGVLTLLELAQGQLLL